MNGFIRLPTAADRESAPSSHLQHSRDTRAPPRQPEGHVTDPSYAQQAFPSPKVGSPHSPESHAATPAPQHEAFESRVHHTDGGAAFDGLLTELAARERKRPAGGNELPAAPHKIGLAHQPIREAEQIVRIGQALLRRQSGSAPVTCIMQVTVVLFRRSILHVAFS